MNKLPLVRCGCSGAVLLISIGIALLLWNSRPGTDVQPAREPELAVRLQTATPTRLVVKVESYGRVQAVRKVQLSAQVAGQVIETAPDLRAGLLVEKGQLLVKTDPGDSENALAEARASVARLNANLNMIETNRASEEKQLKLANRSLELAQTDFDRMKSLSEQGQAVSVSVVEAAERTVTQARSQVVQLEQSLALAPIRIHEVEAELQAAQSRVDQMQLQLARTSIHAPFDGRILKAEVETGEYLQPGTRVLELVDDSLLEIHVPLTASDLRNWLPFDASLSANPGWFPPLKPVAVSIEWSESSADHHWSGTLHRITHFDTTTRTAMVVVRVSRERGHPARNTNPRERGHPARNPETPDLSATFPLTEGMFCKVRIPGRELTDVFALPREAVTFEGRCYISEEGRLKTVEVEVVRSEVDKVYVSRGLSGGDQVIVTRLVAPLEGAKLVEAGE
ncbi:MAG: HlyD family efflux transporter periplasmic adaptor subunit [Kiritimatiellia bacterium]